MSERRQQNWYVPLRVRFRVPTEQTQWDGEHAQHPPLGDGQSHLVGAATDLASRWRTQQIKELIRLGNILRAELGLDEVLQQIVASISSCTGFRSSVINLIEEGKDYLSAVAFAGMSEEDEHILREARDPVEKLSAFMRPEFRISQSYFISHENADALAGYTAIMDMRMDDYKPGGWHPEDALIVPLFSPRKKKLLGILSLDDPEDGKIPTVECMEVVELFANQAATAIDNARIFQEREAEHRALEEGIALLREDLEKIQRGDLRVRVRSTHEKLQPVGDAINIMTEEMSGLLGNVQSVTNAVGELTLDVQRSSDLLARDASHQERHMQHISRAVDEMADTMSQLSKSATKLSRVAAEAMEVTLEGQSVVDRAVEGMRQVREASMLSARIMKRLGESGQEINETVLTITDLTTRMNLVALNAAIEATRSGDHGQGFTAIAQEIRTLAVHSTEAARKVASHIRSIQRETSAISQSVEQNTLEAVKQTELVTQTGVSLDAISVVTEQMTGLVQGICSAADNQAQGSQLVVSAISQISQMTSEITQHVRNMQQSLARLAELTGALRSRVSVFRTSER